MPWTDKKKQILLLTSAPISELPSDIITMIVSSDADPVLTHMSGIRIRFCLWLNPDFYLIWLRVQCSEARCDGKPDPITGSVMLIIKVSNIFIFYIKAIKLHLMSHNIYSRIRRQIKFTKKAWGWGTLWLYHICVFLCLLPFSKEIATQIYCMHKKV